ncbi:hypothetical protein K160097B7_04070 [[Clostridium] hylemonae]
MVLRVPLFGIFTSDPEVILLGSWMLALITPCYIFYVFLEVLSGALKFRPAVDTIIFSYPVSWIISALMFLFYYSYRKRRLV